MATTRNIEKLSRIISSSNINEKSFFALINNLNIQKGIVIYGAGNWGRWLLSLLKGYSVNVNAFLDLKAEMIGKVEGLPVFKPDCNDFLRQEKEEMYILIAANYIYHKKVKQNLNELGYKNVNLVKCVWYPGPLNFEKDLDSIINKKKDFLECAKILEDEKSFRIYEDAISSYVTAECKMSAEAETNNQYFPSDIPFKKGYSKFIDCGAFTGDTITQLRKIKGKVDTVIAFESDVHNFKALAEMIRQNKESIAENILLYPCGVWSRLEQLRFNSGQGSGGVISEDGTSVIQCVALDDVLSDFIPTFIKMDIEGAEYEALLGAKKMIQNYKPDLAISVYHSIIDFCRIPLLINGWNLGYKFYLRCHLDFNQEVVLYAICD
ncbi:MAG: FkbM family methyltransferase [Thermodesulfobacteriota bacterium]